MNDVSDTPELVERVAVRLFWKTEHLDPSAEGDVSEQEWFRDAFPVGMNDRRRSFWRMLAADAIATMREPTEEMMTAADTNNPVWVDEATKTQPSPVIMIEWDQAWRAMIDAALHPRTSPEHGKE